MSAMGDLGDAETVAAMLMLRRRILATDDPVELAGFMAQVGEYVLERLGFDMDQRAAVKIGIGTDEGPDEARITLTWPLPAGLDVEAAGKELIPDA